MAGWLGGRWAAVVAACVALLGLAPARGAGATPEAPSRPPHRVPLTTQRTAVLVLLPAVSLGELLEAQTVGIRSLLTTGAVGVMNARTGATRSGRVSRAIDSLVRHPEEIRPATLEAACLTLGAGTRCSARGEAGLAFEAEERLEGITAADCWAQRTGEPPGTDRIYHTAIVRLQARHANYRYPVVLGALGEALRQAGLATAVVGNADRAGFPHREAACIAMDASGRVPLGAVGSSLWVHDPLAPGGRRTNPDAVLRATEAVVRAGARLVVIETGDTARVDRERENILEALRPRRRREAIERADQIVTGLLERFDPATTLLLLITPAPSLDAASEGNLLVPVVLAGGQVKRGLVYSPSTRTPGLAVLTDIAPTLLDYLRVPIPPQMVGRPLSSRPDIRAPERALALESHSRRVDDYARPLTRRLVWTQVALFGVFFLLAWVRPTPAPGDRRAVRAAALLLAALPAALLLVGTRAPATPAAGAGLLLLLTAGLAGVAVALGRWLSPPGLLWLGAAGLFAYDTLTGSRLLQASPIGYSPYAGARFYGIGNEGFGLLIPAAVLGLVLITSDGRRGAASEGRKGAAVLFGAAVLLLALAVLIGHPSLGANFGGGLSAAVTAVALAALALGRKAGRVLFWAVPLGIAAVVLPVAIDLMRGGESQSHVGRAAAAVGAGGFSEAWYIITRKLQMNHSLLRYSPWSRLLLAAGIACALLLRRHASRLRAENPLVWKALLAVLVGAVGALVFNDSGVLPAAEMAVAAAAALAYVTADSEADR